MAKVSDLPEELLDAVFGQLERVNGWVDPSKKSLKRCSLVCSSWGRLSRRHLFRTITVHTITEKHITCIEEEPDVSVHTPDQLLQFLTTHGHIAHHIKEFSWVNEIGFLETPYSRTLFVGVLLHLPSLKTLELVDMILEPPLLDAGPPTLQLDKLVLQSPETADEEGHLDVIGLFRSIGVLELVEIELDSFSHTPGQLLRCSTFVQPHTLILGNILYDSDFLTALQSTDLTNHVSSVCLDGIEDLGQLRAVSCFLSSVYENLVKLHTLVLSNLEIPKLGRRRRPTFWRRLKQLLTLCQENVSTLSNVEIELTGFFGNMEDDIRALKASLIETLNSSRASQTITITGPILDLEDAPDMSDLSDLCGSGVLRFEY